MKKNFSLKSVFTLIVLLCTMNSYAQERTCGMVDYMDQQMQNPEFAREYNESQDKFKVKLQQILSEENFGRSGRAIVEIPVAVHFPDANEADRRCLEALAQNQIDILNADYTASNADITLWNSAMGFYPETNLGVANISFCLALFNHPVGLDPELLEGEPCITIGYDFGGGDSRDSNWGGYMNFVVRPIEGGILGFSPLGGSIAAGQAVTLNTFAFGSGAGCAGSDIVPNAPYNLGRTTTHELGHFYNLNHTFNGDGDGVCGSGGDGIADTPEVANSTYGCPGTGSVAGCVPGQSALTMSYMDYGDDRCLFMFSAGQATVMDAWATLIDSQIKPNVCSPVVPDFAITANNSPLSSCPSTDTQVVFNLSYETIGGFNEVTTFSASGAPVGASVTFSPTALSSNSNFTMTIGNLSAVELGEYTIQVSGVSATKTERIRVILNNICSETVCDSYASAQDLGLVTIGPSDGDPGIVSDDISIPDSVIIESMTVNVNLSHTYVRDVILQLQHPNGQDFVNLWEQECNNEDDLDITFDDAAGAIVCAEPTVGTYAPSRSLSEFNGLDAQGDWTLIVADFGTGDDGVLNNWSMSICSSQPLSTETFLLENFSIFPNPNDGEFTVKLNSNSGNAINIEVFDIRGRRIFKNSYTNGSEFNQTINLNNAKSGIYLVTVDDGNSKITKKIIVE